MSFDDFHQSFSNHMMNGTMDVHDHDDYPGYEVDYEEREFASTTSHLAAGAPTNTNSAIFLAATVARQSAAFNSASLFSNRSTINKGKNGMIKEEPLQGNYQNLKLPLQTTLNSNLVPRKITDNPSHPSAVSDPLFLKSSAQEKADQAFHQSSQQERHHQQQTNGRSNPINRRSSADTSTRSFQVKPEEPNQQLQGSWLDSSDSSLFPGKPKQIVWADSSEDLLDYYDEPIGGNDGLSGSDHQMEQDGLRRQSPHLDGLMKPPAPRRSNLRNKESVTSAAKTSSAVEEAAGGLLPDHYLSSEGSSHAGSSQRKTNKALHTQGDSDLDRDKKPSALAITKLPPAMLKTQNAVSATVDDRLTRKMRDEATISFVSNEDTAVATQNSTGLPRRVPSAPPLPGTFTSVGNDSNDPVIRKLRGTSIISNPILSNSDKPETYDHPGTSATQPTPNDAYHLKMRAGIINDPAVDLFAVPSEPSPMKKTHAYLLQQPKAPFMPNLDADPELHPLPGTVTAVSNNENDRVAIKVRSSMNYRPISKAPIGLSYDSDNQPGTVTSVANGGNDRVASKIRASMNHQSIATVSAAATAHNSDSDVASEVPPRPGTVTSIAHGSKNDRVANKIHASFNPRITTLSSDSDVPTEEPARPGTVTAVAHGSNDRVSNKIRASLNHRPMATASTDAVGFSSESDVAPEEPSRAGTVTSIANNSSNRVANKIRLSLASRAVATSMAYDSDVTLEEHPEPGTATFSSNNRVAKKIQANSNTTSRPAASMPYDSDVAPEEPSRPGTVTSVTTNKNDRVANKIRSNVAIKPAMTGFSSDSDGGVEEPAGGTITNVAHAKNDLVAKKIRASVANQRPSARSTSSNSDENLEEPRAVAGTATAVARRNDDRVANKLRRGGSERRSAAYSLHSEEAKFEEKHVAIGAVATKGDDPARAKTRWIQDDLFRDEEETGFVEVDPEAYFNQRAQEVAAQRELERIDMLRQKEEEKAGLLRDKQATAKPQNYFGDGLLKTKGMPTSHKSRSARKMKKMGVQRGSSYVQRDETVRNVRKDDYGEPSFWDQLDKPTICVGCIILVAVLVAFITPIVLIRKKGSPPAPPPSQWRTSLYLQFQDMLESVSETNALANQSSPQFKALNFIVYDDLFPLSIDSPNLIQRYVLMVLYYSSGGPIWRSEGVPWGSGVDECEWDYVECDSFASKTNATKPSMRFLQQSRKQQSFTQQQINGTVVGLHFYRAGLLDILPAELRQLSHLVTLDLAENRLEQSTIPSFMYELTELQLLAFENNQFSGTISATIRGLSQLTYLSLFNNQLSGTLPSTIGLLSKLETLYAFGNSPLKGAFFRYALRWPRIQTIDIANNAFTGSIPTEISRLSRLEVLGLADNSFGGTLPTVLGNLPLQILTTSQNTRMIKGTIPTELGLLKSLRYLLLDSGALTGTIPTELGNLRSAVQINLSQNQLQGTLPTQLGMCTSLTELDLNNNDVTGTIPTELGRISDLHILYLEYNKMHGSVPQQICSLRNHSLLVFEVDCAFSTGVQCQVPQCCTSCEQ